MSLESATWINQLVATNPTVADPIAQADDHLRLVKAVLQNQFPNLGTVAVSATAAQINATGSALASGVLSVPSNGTVASGELDLLGLTNAGGTIVAGRVELINSATSAAPGALTIKMTNSADAVPTTALTLSAVGALAAVASVNAPSILKSGNELLPTGVIAFWSGSAASIPTGWALCDGTNGTPNLAGLFILAASATYPAGASGGSTALSSGLAASNGSHNHSGLDGVSGAHSHGTATGTYALQLGDLPAHTHTTTETGHTHTVDTSTISVLAGPNVVNAVVTTAGTPTAITEASATGLTVNSAGGAGGSHQHTISNDGNHQHAISADGTHTHTVTGTIMPPFYSLCAIMKL